jgi:hypothetical protein
MQFYQATCESLKTENIIFGNISQKTVPNVNPPSVYNEIAIEYNYGDAENQLRSPFLWELPEVSTSIGISESDIGGRKKFSIPISLNPASNEEHKKCITLMDATYKACAELIYKNRAALKLPHFMKENPEGSNFKHPVYYPRDKVTLEIIPGKSPSMYLQLSARKDSRTMFCGLDEKPISWDLLKNVQMSFIPLVHFEKIYVGGGKPSLQMKLVSGIVTSVMSKSSVVRQKSTIERLRQAKPELFDNVSKQLEDLKQSSSESTPLTTITNSTSGDDQDYNEETGQERTPEPSPPKAKQSKFSAPPKVGGANRLQDFLKQ